jgi:predicted acetyltransferase
VAGPRSVDFNGRMDTLGEIEVRHTEPHERLAATNAKGVALLAHPMPASIFDENVDSWDDCASFSAWDGPRCVGHAGAYAFEVTVPGGARLPMAGITRVGVVPTHTRRGLLRRMMEPLLHEARDGGQVLSALHASETAIYRRFGFGLGIEAAVVEIDPRAARPRRVSRGRGALTVLEPDEVADTVPCVYDHAARHRPGTIGRDEWMWHRILEDYTRPSDRGFGAPAKVVAVHSTDGRHDGYVRYTVQWDEDFGANPTGVGDLHELWGATPEVEGTLWDYLLEVDLITRWRVEGRPLNDPIVRTLHDARAYRTVAVHDDQWVRLLDVDAALRARTYGPADARVVIEVVDPMFADNCGRWSISPDGAERTDDRADVSVAIDGLSALFHGGQSWRDLASVGDVRIVGSRPERMLARADAAFSVRPLPFCGTPY